MMHQLHGFIDGSVTILPTSVVDLHSGQLISNMDHDTWVRIDQCLRSWFFAMIGIGVLTEVRDLVHWFQIWNRLNSRFNVNGLSRVMELKGILSHLQKSKTQSMEEYLREIKVAADSSDAINSPVSELELINNTIAGLDDTYDAFVTAVQYYGGSSNFDDLRTKLIMFKQQVKLHNKRAAKAANHHAFAANTAGSAAAAAAAGSAASGSANKGRQRQRESQQP